MATEEAEEEAEATMEAGEEVEATEAVTGGKVEEATANTAEEEQGATEAAGVATGVAEAEAGVVLQQEGTKQRLPDPQTQPGVLALLSTMPACLLVCLLSLLGLLCQALLDSFGMCLHLLL